MSAGRESTSSPSTTRDLREEADVVVVGSGPCGAVVAKELAEAGTQRRAARGGPALHARGLRARRRALDGAHHARGRAPRDARPRDADHAGDRARRRLARELGDLRAPAAPSCSTTGRTRFELAHTSRADLDPHFDAVEDFLGIAPTPDDGAGPPQPALPRGLRRARHLVGADRAQRARLPRQRRVLHRLPRAREAVDGRLLRARGDPRRRARLHLGARGARARRGPRAPRACAAHVVAPFTGRRGPALAVDAKAVVLSAGCMATPVLLLASGAREPLRPGRAATSSSTRASR